MTDNEYLKYLYDNGWDIKEANIIYKIFKEFEFDLSYLPIYEDINKLRNFSEFYQKSCSNFQELIDSCIVNKINFLPILHKNFLSINFDSKESIKNKLNDPTMRNFFEKLTSHEYPDFQKIDLYIKAVDFYEIEIDDLLDPDLDIEKLKRLIEFKYHEFDIKPFMHLDLDHLNIIFRALIHNQDNDAIDINKFMDPSLNPVQLEYIYYALTEKLDDSYFLDSSLSNEQCSKILEGLRRGLDVEIYKDLDEVKMECAISILQSLRDETLSNDEIMNDVKNLLHMDYGPGQTKFLCYCLDNLIDINEFKDKMYPLFDMIEIAKFIKYYKNKEVISLKDFKELHIKTKTFVNNMFAYNKEDKLKDLDLNNVDEQMILDNLFEKRTFAENLNDKIKINYINTYIDDKETFLLDNNQIVEVAIDYDPYYEQLYSEVFFSETPNEPRFMDDKFDEIIDILKKTIYFKYDEEKQACVYCSMTRKDANKKDYIMATYYDRSSLFETFDLCMEIDKTELLEMEAFLDDVIMELDDDPENICNLSSLENVNDFHKYGYENYDDKYLHAIVGDYDKVYAYMDIDEIKEKYKKTYNISDEEALGCCVDIFNAEINYYQAFVDGHNYFFRVFENGNEIDTFSDSGNYKEIIRNYLNTNIIEKIENNKEER